MATGVGAGVVKDAAGSVAFGVFGLLVPFRFRLGFEAKGRETCRDAWGNTPTVVRGFGVRADAIMYTKPMAQVPAKIFSISPKYLSKSFIMGDIYLMILA